MQLNQTEIKLLNEITEKERNPICLFAGAQPLIDTLCKIIKYQNNIISEKEKLLDLIANSSDNDEIFKAIKDFKNKPQS